LQLPLLPFTTLLLVPGSFLSYVPVAIIIIIIIITIIITTTTTQ
jgi:hypothetical protein